MPPSAQSHQAAAPKTGAPETSAPETSAPETDGRRQRAVDSRARIVAAMLELVREGYPAPGAEQVAQRAGVGLRTVFRLFTDMDSLYRQMSQRMEAEIRHAFDRPFTAADWRGRLIELIDRRAAMYERTTPYRRALEANRHRSRFLEEDATRIAFLLREILTQQLSPELAADPVRLEALDLVLSYEAWSRLRREQGLTPKQARAVVGAAVDKLVG